MTIMRNVIVLDPTLKINEVDIPYKTFVVMFSGKIMRRIKQEKGWSTVKAYNFVKTRFKYDPYIYKIMEDIIREEQPKIILNRNPTIVFGSILLMTIRKVKKDSDDLTLAVPSAILPGLKSTAQALSPGLTNTYLTAGNCFHFTIPNYFRNRVVA